MSKETVATWNRDTVLPHESRWRVKPFWALSILAAKSTAAALFGVDNFSRNILAFLLGRISIMGELIPFGLAYFLAVANRRKKDSLSVAVWTLAGSLSISYYLEAGVYFLVMLAFAFFSSAEARLQRRLRSIPVLLSAIFVLGGLLFLFWQKIVLYQLMLFGFMIASCLVLTYIFSNGMPLLEASGQPHAAEEQLVCLIVMLSAAIAGIGTIELAGYGLQNIVSGFFIMALALQGGVGLGVSVGTAVGIVTGLSGGNGVFSVAYYSVAALLAGVFNSLGKFAVALGYTAGCVIAVSYYSPSDRIIHALTEAAVGAVLFLAVPAGWWKAWRNKICQADIDGAPDRTLFAAQEKLNRMAEMFADLAAMFGRIKTTGDSAQPEEDIRQIVDKLGAEVCRNCTSRNICWDSQFYQTYQAFLDLLSLPPTIQLDSRSLPAVLKATCIRQKELVKSAAEYVEHKRVLLCWQKNVLNYRDMLAEQMRSAAGIVATLAQEIYCAPKEDKQFTDAISKAALVGGCPLFSVRTSGKGGSLRIDGQKEPCRGDQECMNKLLPLVSEVVGERLTLDSQCGSRALHRRCRLSLSTANRYTVAVGAASIAKDLHDISGDTCSVSEAGTGRIAAIISDGMGSGEKAANESQAAVRFLEKLLKAGFSVDAAVKTVNAMLLLRLPGDSYTTIDMVVFDLYSGEAEFLKTGSAVSYVKRVREVAVVQSATLPVGLLEQVEIEPEKRKLAAGDTVVMVSDGIVEADRQRPRRDWVSNFLRLAPDDDPQRLANLILEQAQRLSGVTVNDDMTVLVIKVHERLGIM